MSENLSQPQTQSGPCGGGPCDEAQQHVWDYLDGELCEGDCEGIKAHLAQCTPCRELFDSEQRMKDAVSRACGCDEAPQDLRSKITAMVSALRSEACGGKPTSD
jgi:mycothiol system anti-sigma-R factor